MQISVDFLSTICYNKIVTKVKHSYVASVVYLEIGYTLTPCQGLKVDSKVGSIPAPGTDTIVYLNYKQFKARKENNYGKSTYGN